MRLRHHRPMGWLAVLVLLFQVVLSADHLGATAARAFAPAIDDVALGILSLCHGDGSVEVLADTDTPTPHAPATPCILCSVATLAANGVVSAPPDLAPPPLQPSVDLPIAVTEAAVVRSPLRYGTERGPPLVIHV
jgi:hypothetical protein